MVQWGGDWGISGKQWSRLFSCNVSCKRLRYFEGIIWCSRVYFDLRTYQRELIRSDLIVIHFFSKSRFQSHTIILLYLQAISHPPNLTLNSVTETAQCFEAELC